ncbi:hypothetical protein DKG74_01135 [Zavarzinia aquatilis]|uniref:Uncharacterized protein n=2 Tax=Zavarzinia aquatilis TaxID=2211142 RepID=A0A317EFT0_9PROT|nr:hypothetical protein DKG74_01135 [Zavarzinia aquatilis]
MIAAVTALPGAMAEASPLDAIAVVNGRLTGDINGQIVDSRDLVGSSFQDGPLTYSIVDAASDPFLPGLWRYRITWKADDGRDWNAMCRNSRGSTGWAYAISADDGPRFVCEDTDMAVCFAKANGLSVQRAVALCLGN